MGLATKRHKRHKGKENFCAFLWRIPSSTRHALVAVFRTQHFKESDGFGVRLNALPRTVRHIGYRDSVFADRVDPGAFGYQVQDHRIVASGGRVVESRVTTIARP